jgi:hypothetical protein
VRGRDVYHVRQSTILEEYGPGGPYWTPPERSGEAEAEAVEEAERQAAQERLSRQQAEDVLAAVRERLEAVQREADGLRADLATTERERARLETIGDERQRHRQELADRIERLEAERADLERQVRTVVHKLGQAEARVEPLQLEAGEARQAATRASRRSRVAWSVAGVLLVVASGGLAWREVEAAERVEERSQAVVEAQALALAAQARERATRDALEAEVAAERQRAAAAQAQAEEARRALVALVVRDLLRELGRQAGELLVWR